MCTPGPLVERYVSFENCRTIPSDERRSKCRYLCVADSSSMIHYLDILRPALGAKYKLAVFQAPYLFFWLLSKVLAPRKGMHSLCSMAIAHCFVAAPEKFSDSVLPLLLQLTGVPDLDILNATYGPRPMFYSGRIERELGLVWTQPRTMALDMVARMDALGIVKPIGDSGAKGKVA